jgi:hypothetical protein
VAVGKTQGNRSREPTRNREFRPGVAALESTQANRLSTVEDMETDGMVGAEQTPSAVAANACTWAARAAPVAGAAACVADAAACVAAVAAAVAAAAEGSGSPVSADLPIGLLNRDPPSSMLLLSVVVVTANVLYARIFEVVWLPWTTMM